jgi:hypothetical protein
VLSSPTSLIISDSEQEHTKDTGTRNFGSTATSPPAVGKNAEKLDRNAE